MREEERESKQCSLDLFLLPMASMNASPTKLTVPCWNSTSSYVSTVTMASKHVEKQKDEEGFHALGSDFVAA